MKIEKAGRVRQYWRKCVDSMHNNMSRGAENITKLITNAHGDGWRRLKNQHRKSK